MLDEEGIEHALLTSYVSFRYFTGYQATIEIEPSSMTPVRMVKDAEELESMAEVLALCDLGQKTARQKAAKGHIIVPYNMIPTNPT